MQLGDRRRLETSIPQTAHRGLRMLCSDEIINLSMDCPINTADGEYACVKISNIRLDMKKIQEMIEPILKKLVNPPADDAFFDQIASPLTYLDQRIPGLSDALDVSFVVVSFLLHNFLVC